MVTSVSEKAKAVKPPFVMFSAVQPSKLTSFGAVIVGGAVSSIIISKLSVAEQLASTSFTVTVYVPAGSPLRSCVLEFEASSQV